MAETEPLTIQTIDVKKLVTDSNITSLADKGLKLIELKWSDGKTITRPPPVELGVPLELKYSWDATHEIGHNKLTLSINDSAPVQEFFKSVEQQAIDLASKISQEVTGNFMDAETIRSFKWFTNPTSVKLKFDPTRCKMFSVDFDQEEGKIAVPIKSIDKIEEGSKIWATISMARIWFANQFGITYNAELIAIKRPEPPKFDFLLGEEAGGDFVDNRMWTSVNIQKELDFEHDIYNHPSYGSPMYFFNMKKAESEKMNCPFGYKDQDDDPSKGYGSVQLDIGDSNLHKFFSGIDDLVTTEVAERWSKWFSSKTGAMTADRLRQFLYISVLKKSKDPKYPDRVKMKVYTDPENKKKCVKVYVMQPDGTHRAGTHLDMTSGCKIVPQFVISNLWFKGNKANISSMGTTLVVKSALVYPSTSGAYNIKKISGFKIREKRQREETGDSEESDKARSKVEEAAEFDYDGVDDAAFM